ncbi:YqgE/AlgH family protein [Macellibacteroides fermentans]|uniref:YqgE/AlgH family protein n=1 Tax=Macellibacteroides fermentans TaxID=879969 RepID=UPI00406C193F
MAQYNNIFKITHNNVLPEKGHILISEPFLQDAYFQRSVVLLVEHDKKGSMGFVLNKKLEMKLNRVIPEFENLPDIPVYLGGPVASDRLFFIHSLGDTLIPEAVEFSKGLYMGGDFDALKRYILAGHKLEGKVKFFLGYSGWTENQLSSEINQDAWVVGESSCNKVMLAEDESFWKASLSGLGGRYKTWSNFPKDPFLN